MTLAMGCMRLSTEPDRDEEAGVAVLHAALDAGITLIDTANAYCLDDHEIGHNERLIARALAAWSGDRAGIRIATKGGLTRPGGRWSADGRAGALRRACEESLQALGVDRIHLYQLHAPDPQVPLATSVRALHALRRDGIVESIGLCNVTVGQIEEARRITDIASVQVEVSLWQDASILSGVIEYCEASRIQVLAYRPLGGSERRRRVSDDPLLADLGARHGVTPFEIALAAVRALSPVVIALPGATRVETARSIARTRSLTLTDDDCERLAGRFPAWRARRRAIAARNSPQPPRAEGEIVIVMGLPGAGKSTFAETLVADGYGRLNRDETGGSLDALLPGLDRELQAGRSRIVLDNTYVSRKSRAGVIHVAAQHGVPVRCVWLATTIDDAQVNAVRRIVSKYGRLPEPDELRTMSRRDTAVFGPMVQYRYQRELEPPDASEGLAAIERRSFGRRWGERHTDRAVLVWGDEVLYRSRSGARTPRSRDDLELLPGRRSTLRRYEGDGWRVLGLAWVPEIAGKIGSAADAAAIFASLAEMLGVGIEVAYCPHAAGPPTCWCRKPLPGLGVLFIERYHLDPARCIYVGSGPQDPGFARRLGFQYRDAAGFFAGQE